jgi:hypothetical protein
MVFDIPLVLVLFVYIDTYSLLPHTIEWTRLIDVEQPGARTHPYVSTP